MLVESLSGIRGIFGTDLTEDIVRRYAVAFAKRLIAQKTPSVVIGRDTRPSSEQMALWMREELFREGIKEVYDCGVAATGAMHIAVTAFKVGGGIVVTASHNEPEWNGIKFMRQDSALLYPEEAEQLIAQAHATSLASGPVDVSKTIDGSLRLVQEYALLVLRTIGEKARVNLAKYAGRILVDANGGSIIPFIKPFIDQFMPLDLTLKGEKLGEFWRTVEPKAESLTPLVDMLEVGKESFAVAFDCDADRMEIVMPKTSAFAKLGTPFVSGQYVLGLVVKAVLSTWEEDEKPIVVTNCATSNLVQDIADEYGARLDEVDVGEINVVKRMQELGSPVGGEGSSAGGIIPPMTGRDGLMTLAVIFRYLGETEKTLDEALVDLPRYTTLQAKVEIDPAKALKVRKELVAEMKKHCEHVRTFGSDGGVKCIPARRQFVTFRMSKTEAGVYRVIVDARDQETAEKLLADGKQTLMRLAKKV